MVKVFLVEDEIVVREGIKCNINWEEFGFIFVGEASDGELAYPMIQNIKPDVVITDIRMPFMGGLELSRLLKNEMPHIKIIILSGYGEFEYAKEAIDIGVTRYLLKPINRVELIKCLVSVRDTILKDRELAAGLELVKEGEKYEEVNAKSRFFYKLVSKCQSLITVLYEGKMFDLDLSALFYNIGLLRIDVIYDQESNVDIKLRLTEELDNIFINTTYVYKFDYSFNVVALLFKGNSKKEIMSVQETYINKIKQLLDSYPMIRYYGGIGVPVNRLGELPKSYQEASKALAHRLIYNHNDIADITSCSQTLTTPINQEAFDIGKFVGLNKSEIDSFLRIGDREDIKSFLDVYLKNVSDDSRNSLLFRQYMIIDIYMIIIGFLNELGYETSKISEPFKDISQMNSVTSSFDSIRNYIETVIRQAFQIRDDAAKRHSNVLVNKAKEYIKKNFSNPDLSLNLVASSIFISASHFSTIFSQESGETFIKYLTDLRMEKAKEMLKCTDISISEIGYLVGYKDPHYFSSLFSKTQNCSPKQYRHTNKNGVVKYDKG